MTAKRGTADSLAPCTPAAASAPKRGLPSAGVLLGQAQRASKSMSSSGPLLSSECRLGARAASKAERSRTLLREMGREKVGLKARSGGLPAVDCGDLIEAEDCWSGAGF